MKRSRSVILAQAVFIFFVVFWQSCKVENQPPYISIVEVTPRIIEAGQIATVSVFATEPDNDLMVFEYNVDGGFINGRGSVVQWHAPNAVGAFNVTVTVTDGRGGSDVGTGSLIVTAPPTKIYGTIKLPDGVIGDLKDIKVGLYTSWEDWEATSPFLSTGVKTEATGFTYAFDDLEPGTYLLDAWSDNDGNQIWSTGDYVGWHGSGGFEDPVLDSIMIEKGQTILVNVTVREI